MENSSSSNDELINAAVAGDNFALAGLFEQYRVRLKRMIDLRMDRRMRGRVDASDISQEAYVDLVRQLPDYADNPAIPFFIWVRRVTGQRLSMLHRKHVKAAKRDPNLEVAIRDNVPEASSVFLASQLVGQFTSASQRVMRDERQARLQAILDEMSPQDREIIALRHFEMLDNGEVAALLQISDASAGMRHLRALKRLKKAISELPQVFDSQGDFVG